MPAGQPRNIGIICCMHPDEEKSREAYEYFSYQQRRDQVPNIDVVIGNELAYEAGLRYTNDGANLNTVFPGDPTSPIYERRRAAELTEWAKKFDIVLDIHGNPIEGGDCLWLHPSANLTLRGIARYLDFTRIVTTQKHTITGTMPNVACIELSPNTHVKPWSIWNLAIDLAAGMQYTEDPRSPYEWYEYLGSVPHNEAMAVHPSLIPPFTPLPSEVITHLGLQQSVHALAWGMKEDPEVGQVIEDPWITGLRQRQAEQPKRRAMLIA